MAFAKRGSILGRVSMLRPRVGKSTAASIPKKGKVAELGQFETCIREDLNERVERRFAVLDPLKIARLAPSARNRPDHTASRLQQGLRRRQREVRACRA